MKQSVAIALGVLIVACVCFLFATVRQEIGDWNAFYKINHCRAVGQRDTSNGEVTKGQRWSPSPQQTVYACDNGVTVIR